MTKTNTGTTNEDPIVLMELGDNYESVRGQDWEAEDFEAHLPTPKVPFFEIIRDAPFGIPLTNGERCEQWLISQCARHYGVGALHLSRNFCYEIHQVSECFVLESKKSSTMKTPQNIGYCVIDRPLLWYLYLCSNDVNLPFLLCVNSIVQDFINLSVADKAICHRRAYEFSTIQNMPQRVNPRQDERAFAFKGNGKLRNIGVHETVERALTNL